MFFISLLIFRIDFHTPIQVDIQRFVKQSSNIGLEVSNFMWSNRPHDLLAQAFILFATAACCTAMLRAGRGEGGEGGRV